MKKIIFAAIAAAALSACCSAPVKNVHPEWTYNTVVYEVNVRQFSPEGTFKGVEAQLPRLKDLGVDILWLMPINEIGTEGRKGTLGSYYAISDYKAVNPEFGTMQDFEDLLAAAHAQGFRVILDWVANQTAPDNVWRNPPISMSATPSETPSGSTTGPTPAASITRTRKSGMLRKMPCASGSTREWTDSAAMPPARCPQKHGSI